MTAVGYGWWEREGATNGDGEGGRESGRGRGAVTSLCFFSVFACPRLGIFLCSSFFVRVFFYFFFLRVFSYYLRKFSFLIPHCYVKFVLSPILCVFICSPLYV